MKKILMIGIMALVLYSFAYAYPLDYTTSTATTKNLPTFGTQTPDLAIDRNTTTYFHTRTGVNGGEFNITLNATYNITHIGAIQFYDGSASNYPFYYTISIGTTPVKTAYYDGGAALNFNDSLTGTSDYIRINFTFTGAEEYIYVQEFTVNGETVPPPPFSTTLNYPNNNTNYKGNWNESILITLSNIDGANVVCDINNTDFTLNTTIPYGNQTIVYKLNDNVTPYDTRLTVNCTDYTTNASLDINFTVTTKKVALYDNDGNLATSTCTLDGTSYTGNTFNIYTWDKTSLLFECSQDDNYIAYSTTLLNDGNDINLTRNKIPLTLYFSESVNATITTINPEIYYMNFTNVINITQSSLPLGKVTVKFGKVNGTEQTYEYINDYLTYINTNLTVIDGVDTEYYVLIETSSGNGIADASIMVYEFNTTSVVSYVVPVKVGLYLSDNRQPTLINLDSDKRYQLYIQKSGFESKNIAFIDPNTVTATINNPKVIELASLTGTQITPYSIWTNPLVLINQTAGEDISLFLELPIYANIQSNNQVYIVTDYRHDNGAGFGFSTIEINGVTDYWKSMGNNRDCTVWDYLINDWDENSCTIYTRNFDTTLEEGIDFLYNQTFINLTIMTRYNEHWHNSTHLIPIITENYGQINLETDSTWSKTTLLIISFIILLITTMFVKYYSQNQDLAFNVYMIGLLICTLISNSAYIIGITIILYYGLLWIKSVSGESNA